MAASDGEAGGERHLRIVPPDGTTAPPRSVANTRRTPGSRRTGDWTQELRASLRTADDLSRALALTPDEVAGARRAEREGLPIRITPYYLALCDRHDPSCPIRLQCVPRAGEAVEVPGDLADPLGEVAHEVAPHLVQRYPDRALLLVTDFLAGRPTAQ